jgi:hypothetical protein
MYRYWVFEQHPKIDPDQPGNYIYATIENNQWVPVYIGQGDISVRCSQAHHQVQCINSKRATHVHMHKNVGKDAREMEEADLLANFPMAYAPSGCNIKAGG